MKISIAPIDSPNEIEVILRIHRPLKYNMGDETVSHIKKDILKRARTVLENEMRKLMKEEEIEAIRNSKQIDLLDQINQQENDT